MTKHTLPPWMRRLPQDDPSVLDVRLMNVEEQLQEHSGRISKLEDVKAWAIQVPWQQVLPMAAVLVSGLAMNAKPEEIVGLIKALRGG